MTPWTLFLLIIVPLLPKLPMVPSQMHTPWSISFCVFFTHSVVNMLLSFSPMKRLGSAPGTSSCPWSCPSGREAAHHWQDSHTRLCYFLPLSMQIKFFSLASSKWATVSLWLPSTNLLCPHLLKTLLQSPKPDPSPHSQLLHLWSNSFNSNTLVTTASYLYPSSFSLTALWLLSHPNWTSRLINWTIFLTMALFLCSL